MSLYSCIVCKLDRLYFVADVPWIVVNMAEFCKEYHLHGSLLFPGPEDQGSVHNLYCDGCNCMI